MSGDWKYLKLKLQERWENFCERLQIRRRINAHPRLVIGASAVSGLLLLWIVFWMLSGKPAENEFDLHGQVYFYDLNTGELFPASAGSIPPIEAPSGNLPDGQPAGVRAHVLQYFTEDSRQGEPFVGWLEKPDPAVETSVYLQSRTAGGKAWGQGMLIKRPEDTQWVKANTPQGLAVIEKARKAGRWGNLPLPVYPDESD